VPGIKRNLFSFGRIADQGFSVDFTSRKVTITQRRTKDILCHDSRLPGRGLYKLDIESIDTLEAHIN
jgi:hypothetical protein